MYLLVITYGQIIQVYTGYLIMLGLLPTTVNNLFSDAIRLSPTCECCSRWPGAGNTDLVPLEHL